MKFLSLIFILFSLVSLSSCSRINYNEDRKRDGKPIPRPDKEVPEFTLKDIKDLDLEEIQKKAKIKVSSNCRDYESGVPSVHIVSDSIAKLFKARNPLRSLKNCMAKAIDDSLKPLCQAEKNLDRLEKEHKGNDQALDQIDEYRDNIEEAKDIIVDQILDFADDIDDAYGKEEDRLLDKNDGFGGKVLGTITNMEFGSLSRFFEFKANSVCFGTIDFSEKD